MCRLRGEMKRACLIAGLLICISVSQAFAQEALRKDSFYLKLSDIAAAQGSSRVLGVISLAMGNASQQAVAFQWLKDRVMLKKDSDPFYAVYYSDLLFATAQTYDNVGRIADATDFYRLSHTMLSIFEMMSLTDGVRCKDPTVAQAMKRLVTKRTAYFQPLKDRLTLESYMKDWRAALAYEDSVTDRAPNAQLCATGVEGMRAEQANPDRPYVPDYLDTTAWKLERNQIRAMVQRRLSSGD